MYCQKCGKQISDDSKFCSYCGEKNNFYEEKQTVAFRATITLCPKCTKELPEGSSFCAYCGEKNVIEKNENDKVALGYTQIQSKNRMVYMLDTEKNSKGVIKDCVKYFLGLMLYIFGFFVCVVYYKAMLSVENIFLSYFDMDNNYWIAFGFSFLCVLAGAFLMLGNATETKPFFNAAWTLSILSCIMLGGLFVWMLIYAVPYIGL